MTNQRYTIGAGHHRAESQQAVLDRAGSRRHSRSQSQSESVAQPLPEPTSPSLQQMQFPSPPSANRSQAPRDPEKQVGRPTTIRTSAQSVGEKTEQRPVPPVRGPPGPPGGFLSARMSRSREIAFNVMICMVQLIPQACLTTCFPSSSTIAQAFHIQDPALLPWMIAAYGLTFGTFILIAGRLGDIFGHKRMVVLGFGTMATWSAVAALSHWTRYEVFFAARAMQGIGSAMMNPNGLALLGRTYAPGSKQKIIAFSLFGLCAPLGAYLGMLMGALFSEFVQWYWTFYVLAILSVLLAGLAQIIFISPPPSPKQLQPFSKKLGEMDWLGAFTGVTGLVCIEVAWVCAPSEGWKTQFVFMLLIMGLLLIGAFGVVETRLAAQPLVPFKLLKLEVGFVLAAVACGWATFGIWSWYLWRWLLGVQNDKPLQACLHVLPIVPVALVASVVTAVMMRKARPAFILIFALTAFAAGPLLLLFVKPGQSYWAFMFLSLLVMPWGMDASMPSAMMIMSNALPMDKQGIAGSLVSTVVNYSISLGLGFAATAEVEVTRATQNPVQGIRAAYAVAVGVGVVGMIVTIVFLATGIMEKRRGGKRADEMAATTNGQTTSNQMAGETGNPERRGTADSQATLTENRRTSRALAVENKRGSVMGGKRHSQGIFKERYSTTRSSLMRPLSLGRPYSAEQELRALVGGPASCPPSRGDGADGGVDPGLVEFKGDGPGFQLPRRVPQAHKRTGSWESMDFEEIYTYERPRTSSGSRRGSTPGQAVEDVPPTPWVPVGVGIAR